MRCFLLHPFFQFSCSRYHAITLDVNFTVWNFKSWGRPFRLVSPTLDCSSPETTPAQIECNLGFSAVLTKSGDIYVWLVSRGALGDRYKEGIAELDKDESTKAIIPDDGTVIPCHTWEINQDPVKLPILPELPDFPGTGLPEEERMKEIKLIKIAALSHELVGLTNKGHVLVLDGLYDEDPTGTWHYVCMRAQTILYLYSNDDTQLPNFSEIDKVKQHPAFHPSIGDDGQPRPPEVELSLDTMLITDVSYITSISSEFISKISQRLGFCGRKILLRLLILHGSHGRIPHHSGNTSNHHPGTSGQICHLCCLWLRPLWCSHLLREASDVGQVFPRSFRSWRPWKASYWIPRRVRERERGTASQQIPTSWSQPPPSRCHSSDRSEVRPRVESRRRSQEVLSRSRCGWTEYSSPRR